MNSKFCAVRKLLLVAPFVMSLAFAQDVKSPLPPEKGDVFALPITFTGAWFFKNSETGTEFKGDMKVVLTAVVEKKDGGISYSGLYSYDGRQTNNKCSTYGIFGGDKPVALRFDHKGEKVYLTLNLPCPVGAGVQNTQIAFNFDRGTIQRESNQPWGKGYQSLKIE